MRRTEIMAFSRLGSLQSDDAKQGQGTMNRSVDRLLQLLAEKGTRQYGEEKVSQCEHALQSAALAEHEGAAGTLVVAALLHDIGHLLYDGERPAARGIDDRHEELGAAYLAQAFGPAVAEPCGCTSRQSAICARRIRIFRPPVCGFSAQSRSPGRPLHGTRRLGVPCAALCRRCSTGAPVGRFRKDPRSSHAGSPALQNGTARGLDRLTRRLLAAADEGHLGRHHGHEQDVGLERQARHVDDRPATCSTSIVGSPRSCRWPAARRAACARSFRSRHCRCRSGRRRCRICGRRARSTW